MSDFVKSIHECGGEVYIVGGAVRNYLYNYYHNTSIKIKDYDFLVRLVDQEKLIKILEKSGTIKEVGQSFGIIIYNPFGSKNSIEIAIPRTEISTGPKYKDFTIVSNENITIGEDFSRRDATMNAIAIKIESLEDLNLFKNYEKSEYEKNIGKIADPFGGIEDVKNKIWKCVGNPVKRFNEDPTRIMRAFRQSTELSLTIESETFNAILENYEILQKLIPQSYVRLFNEFFKILLSDNYLENIKKMCEIGILQLMGIKNPNLKQIFFDDTVNLNLINNKITLIKFATLLRVHTFEENIKIWCHERQITATNYFSPNDLHILISIENFSSEILNVDSKYQLLKIIEKIYKNYKNNCNEIIQCIVCYLYVDGMMTIERYKYMIELIHETKKYPYSTDDIAINGEILMSKWNLKGKKIKVIKDYLLDSIFNDLFENNLQSLENCVSYFIEKNGA